MIPARDPKQDIRGHTGNIHMNNHIQVIGKQGIGNINNTINITITTVLTAGLPANTISDFEWTFLPMTLCTPSVVCLASCLLDA